MATREYRAAPGTDVIDAAGNGWLIAGLEINNPSGSWLRVEGIEAYVPPFTMGWTMPLLPAQQTVTIRFVDSPSGTPSENIGGELVVRVSDVAVPASQGFPSGAAQSAAPGIARVQLDVQAVEVLDNGTGGASNIVAAVPDSIIVPFRLYASPMPFGAGSGSVIEALNLRSMVVIEVWTIAPPMLVLPTFSISPEAPFASVDFPGGMKLPIGEPLRVQTYGLTGAGVQWVSISALFYRETLT